MLPANRQESDKRCTTIREAVKFAKSNNLLGVIFDSTIFKQVPTLVDATKDYGEPNGTQGECLTSCARPTARDVRLREP
jgi:hypothetical protein